MNFLKKSKQIIGFYKKKYSPRKIFLIVFSFVLITSLFTSNASASSLNLSSSNVVVMTDDVKILEEKHSLIDNNVLNIYIINLQGKINISYKHQNGSTIKELNGFSSDVLTLPWIKEARLEIRKNDVLVFSTILHEANYENTARYLFGKDAQTPGLARINMFLCFLVAVCISSVFVYKVVVPLFDDIEHKEL